MVAFRWVMGSSNSHRPKLEIDLAPAHLSSSIFQPCLVLGSVFSPFTQRSFELRAVAECSLRMRALIEPPESVDSSQDSIRPERVQSGSFRPRSTAPHCRTIRYGLQECPRERLLVHTNLFTMALAYYCILIFSCYDEEKSKTK